MSIIIGSIGYDLGINLIGGALAGLLSGAIVALLTSWWQSRASFRWQMVRLRNTLYDIETYLRPEFHHRLTPDSWTNWLDSLTEIRHVITEIGERLSMWWYRRTHYRRPRAEVISHFRTIGSHFVEHECPYLGVIECITEARNLVTATRVSFERNDQEQLRGHQDRIRQHREHVELLVPDVFRLL